MPDEDPDHPSPAQDLPRYPGTAPPPPPGPTTDQPSDQWYPPPGTPGGYYPPGTTPPPRWGGSTDPYQGGGATPGSAPLAGYWARVGGLILDGVIIFLVSLVYLLPTHAFRGMQSTGTGHPRLGVSGGGVLLNIALGALYAGLLIGLRGQTIGMMALRIKAIDATTGALIGFPRALGRDLFMRLLGFLFLIPLVIDLLFPAWDPRRQTLHDKVVNSVVIRV